MTIIERADIHGIIYLLSLKYGWNLDSMLPLQKYIVGGCLNTSQKLIDLRFVDIKHLQRLVTVLLPPRRRTGRNDASSSGRRTHEVFVGPPDLESVVKTLYIMNQHHIDDTDEIVEQAKLYRWHLGPKPIGEAKALFNV